MTVEPMPVERFWKLLERCGDAPSPEECDLAVETLGELLRELPPADVAGFERTLRAQLHRAYTWGLWGAAYLINGGCSDDGFEYFRGWLVLQGREVFEEGLRDPDSLAGVVMEGDLECESVLNLPFQVYEELTGEPLPPGPPGPAKPAGEPWEEEALPQRFPRLAAMFA